MKNEKKSNVAAKAGKAPANNTRNNKTGENKSNQSEKKNGEGLEQHGSIKNSK